MDLWIRSQDKKELIPIEHKIYIEQDGEGNSSIFHSQNLQNEYYRDLLGVYKTEKHALEVLDEIQKCLEINININKPYQESDLYIKGLILGNMVKVYNMPKE